jgi:hypothetical protein
MRMRSSVRRETRNRSAASTEVRNVNSGGCQGRWPCQTWMNEGGRPLRTRFRREPSGQRVPASRLRTSAGVLAVQGVFAPSRVMSGSERSCAGSSLLGLRKGCERTPVAPAGLKREAARLLGQHNGGAGMGFARCAGSEIRADLEGCEQRTGGQHDRFGDIDGLAGVPPFAEAAELNGRRVFAVVYADGMGPGQVRVAVGIGRNPKLSAKRRARAPRSRTPPSSSRGL